MEIFNINQTIMGSLFVGKEQNELNKAPELMHRDAIKKTQELARRMMEEVQQTNNVDSVHLNPEEDTQPKNRRRPAPQEKSADEPEEKAAETPEPPPETPLYLGNRIDIRT